MNVKDEMFMKWVEGEFRGGEEMREARSHLKELKHIWLGGFNAAMEVNRGMVFKKTGEAK